MKQKTNQGYFIFTPAHLKAKVLQRNINSKIKSHLKCQSRVKMQMADFMKI